MDGNIGNYEDVNYGCYGILQLTNHLNSTIFYKINNRWNRDQDFSDFHNYYNTAGVTLSIRLQLTENLVFLKKNLKKYKRGCV